MRRLSFRAAVLGVLTALAHGGPLAAQTAPGAPGNNDSAYVALRLLGKTLGKDALERIVEVTGHDGVPQPYLWRIVLQEGADGTREVDVAGGKVAAQRTGSKPPPSKSTVHLQDLNLDSSGAFDAADAQARKVRLRFDSVNYVLRTNEASGKPQWTLDLLDKEGVSVGAMRLGANDGNTLSIEGRLASGPAAAASPRPAVVGSSGRGSESTTTSRAPEPGATGSRPRDPAATNNRVTESRTTTTTTTVSEPPPPPPPSVSSNAVVVEDNAVDREEGGLFTRTGRTLDKTSRTVEQTLRKTGERLQRFFTGHGDADQEEPPRDPKEPPRDPNFRGTEVSRNCHAANRFRGTATSQAGHCRRHL